MWVQLVCNNSRVIQVFPIAVQPQDLFGISATASSTVHRWRQEGILRQVLAAQEFSHASDRIAQELAIPADTSLSATRSKAHGTSVPLVRAQAKSDESPTLQKADNGADDSGLTSSAEQMEFPCGHTWLVLDGPLHGENPDELLPLLTGKVRFL